MALRSKATSADGMLTTSGLLYEGNLTEWLGRINAALILHNLGLYTLRQAHSTSRFQSKYGCTDDELAERRRAEQLIRSMVSPRLLRRLTDFDYTPAELFRILKMLAQPFQRLFDLPPELRETIFADVFSNPRGAIIGPKIIMMDAIPHMNRDLLAPKLLQVSQQIRNEATPVFYSTTRFSVLLDIDGHGAFDTIDDGLRSWLEVVVQENKKHIHHMQLELQWTGTRGHYLKTFNFDHHGAQGGLKIKLPIELEDKSKARVEEHLASIRIENGAPGNELLSALLKGNALWQLGGLDYTNDDPDTPF